MVPVGLLLPVVWSQTERSTMASTLSYLETLIPETQKPEAEVMATAFHVGSRHLWREHVLRQFLRGTITREEKIASVGMD